jgi:hypothetical protein
MMPIAMTASRYNKSSAVKAKVPIGGSEDNGRRFR